MPSISALLTSILLSALPLLATNHYILPAGSGTHSGADWNNACVGFAGNCNSTSSMVRGDTYYVGGGSYSAVTFEISESSTSVITIKGATAADHGTATGWSASYGVDVTQASLGYPLSIYNGYVVFDGNTGSGQNGSSYGFTVPTPTCSNVTDVNLGPGGTTMRNVQVSHFYFPGCVADTATQAIAVQTTTTAIGFTYSYNYFNHWQVAVFVLNSSNFVVDHNIITNGQSYSDNHGDLIDLLNSATNVTVSNNTLIGCAGTVCMGANDTGANCSGGVSGSIYGNVFATSSTIGNGIIGATTRCYFTNTLLYNNTFTGTTTALPWFAPCQAGGMCSSATGNVAENNIIWNASCALGPGTWTDDYNGYYSCVDTAPTETHGQAVASLDPFVNSAANNYLPAEIAVASCSSNTATCTGLALSSPYNTDPNGFQRDAVAGVWQRGAYAFESSDPPSGSVIGGALALTGGVQIH